MHASVAPPVADTLVDNIIRPFVMRDFVFEVANGVFALK